MNKTIHKKLTATSFNSTATMASAGIEQVGLMRELDLLLESSKDLLQPRPQAIANILKMAKSI